MGRLTKKELATKVLTKKVNKKPTSVFHVLDKHPDMLDSLFLYYGQEKTVFLPTIGYVDFKPESIFNIERAESLTYDDYIDIQLTSSGKEHRWLEIGYYNVPVWFNGQIEKILQDHICFRKLYLCGIYQEGKKFNGTEEYIWMDQSGFETLCEGDCVAFQAEIYRCLKKRKDYVIDYGLRNPSMVRKINE